MGGAIVPIASIEGEEVNIMFYGEKVRNEQDFYRKGLKKLKLASNILFHGIWKPIPHPSPLFKKALNLKVNEGSFF